MKKTLLLLLFTTTYLFTNASTFYVSNFGNDGNSGSVSTPWQHIQYGLDQLSPGDSLLIFGGLYNEKLTWSQSGTALAPIVVMGHLGSPQIDGTGLSSQTALLNMSDLSYVVLSNVTLQNNSMNDAQGIYIEGAGDFITLDHIVIHDIHFSTNPADLATAATNAQGIIVYGTDGVDAITNLKISYCTIYNCRLGYSEGLAINGNVNGFNVELNELYDLSNIGIDIIGNEGTSPVASTDKARNGIVSQNTVYNCVSPYAASAGIYVDGGHKIIVERNFTHHNNYGIEIGCEAIGKITDSIVVRNNIMSHNTLTGLAFGGFDYPSGSGKVTYCRVHNNTFYKNATAQTTNGEMVASYFENSIFRNNVFDPMTQNSYFSLESTSKSGWNYNFYQSPNGTVNINDNGTAISLLSFSVVSGNEAQGIAQNTYFGQYDTNEPGFFELSSSFLTGNNGDNSQISVGELDFFGTQRIQDVTVDRGANEGGNAFIEKLENKELYLYPNPASDFLSIYGQETIAELIVYNSTGQIVPAKLTENSISLESFSPGIYLFQVKFSSGKVSSQKISVQ